MRWVPGRSMRAGAQVEAAVLQPSWQRHETRARGKGTPSALASSPQQLTKLLTTPHYTEYTVRAGWAGSVALNEFLGCLFDSPFLSAWLDAWLGQVCDDRCCGKASESLETPPFHRFSGA